MDCLGKQLGDGAKSRKAEGTDTGCCVAHKSVEIVVLPISRDARFAQGQLTQMMSDINYAIPEPDGNWSGWTFIVLPQLSRSSDLGWSSTSSELRLNGCTKAFRAVGMLALQTPPNVFKFFG